MSASTSVRARKTSPKVPAIVAKFVPAKVLTMLPLLIGFYDPTGLVIDTKSTLDPRENYCNDYNAFSGEAGRKKK